MANFTNVQCDKMFGTGGGKRAAPRHTPANQIFKFGSINPKLILKFQKRVLKNVTCIFYF